MPVALALLIFAVAWLANLVGVLCYCRLKRIPPWPQPVIAATLLFVSTPLPPITAAPNALTRSHQVFCWLLLRRRVRRRRIIESNHSTTDDCAGNAMAVSTHRSWPAALAEISTRFQHRKQHLISQSKPKPPTHALSSVKKEAWWHRGGEHSRSESTDCKSRQQCGDTTMENSL
jgi:hypothetical protein